MPIFVICYMVCARRAPLVCLDSLLYPMESFSFLVALQYSYIGKVNENLTFDIVYKSDGLVKPIAE